MLELLSGNEAVAQGAWEAGASIGSAYPGTPSTETMEAFAKKPGVYAEWAINEKVAFEVALGASAAGARSLVSMKHVGVNVASDPLYTAAYTGVNGGMLILAADDPGMYSSQNEQDSRFHAMASHVPCLDPSDSQEAHDFAKLAYEISERFDVPVMIRSTVRLSHTRCAVEIGEQAEFAKREYVKDPAKWIMMPAYSRPKRKVQLERIAALQEWADETPLNKVTGVSQEIGIICSGAVYQHVREAMPEASILKLGVTYPIAPKLVAGFAQSVQNVYVVEEGSDYLHQQVRALGITLSESVNPIPLNGEITAATVAQAFGKPESKHADNEADLPGRPPALCTGCPHRVVFKELSRLKAIVTGDIGCYTLGASAPLNAIDTVVDMGASVSMSHGFELAMADTDHKPIFAVIGDSTFAHSGLSSLISTVYNQGSGNICILDNRTTAMTGHQGNPFNGETLQHRASRELDLEGLIRSLGIEDVETIDPYDVKAVRSALKSAMGCEGLSVRIFKHPCILLERQYGKPYEVNASCTGCGVCASIGCPAISRDPQSNLASIDSKVCIGCGQCAQYCASNSIVLA